MARSRPITDAYIAAVERAVASPGVWIEVPRRFRTEFNANITADCLRGGYLRVEVRPDDTEIVVAGKRYLKTPTRVMTRVEQDREGWLVRIQAPPPTLRDERRRGTRDKIVAMPGRRTQK